MLGSLNAWEGPSTYHHGGTFDWQAGNQKASPYLLTSSRFRPSDEKSHEEGRTLHCPNGGADGGGGGEGGGEVPQEN